MQPKKQKEQSKRVALFVKVARGTPIHQPYSRCGLSPNPWPYRKGHEP